MNTVDTTYAAPAQDAPVGLHYGLWGLQLLLAAMFLMAGGMKMTAPIADLRQQMPWVDGAMGGMVRFIGFAEVLGAIGLVAPSATRVMPRLTPIAASCLALVMALAAATHGARGEVEVIGVNVVLGALLAAVAWGRSVKAPIAAR